MYSDANRFFYTLLLTVNLFFSRFVAFESSLKVSRPEDELGYLCNVVPSMTVDGSDS